MTKHSKAKKVTRRDRAWGILNAYGEFWTPMVFTSPAQAADYIHGWTKEYDGDFSKHKVVEISVCLTYSLPKIPKRKRKRV